MKIQILLMFILCFLGCNEYEKIDLNGNWVVYPEVYDEPKIWQINFNDSYVEWLGDWTFKEKGNYEVLKDEIIIERQLDNYEIRTKLLNIDEDTISIFDSLEYYRVSDFIKSKFEAYELLGVETDQYLSQWKRPFHTIHFYKNSNEKTKIRLADKEADYEQISFFLSTGHRSKNTNVLLFVGKGIKLEDLKRMYFQLAANRKEKVWIVTKKSGFSDYSIFVDHIDVWWKELKLYLDAMNQPSPPPPTQYLSKEEYLEHGGELILIEDQSDIIQINSITEHGKYLFLISNKLEIENYIELKNKLQQKRQQFAFQYKTKIQTDNNDK